MRLPVDPSAERAALGSCLASQHALAYVVGFLEPEDFYSDLHREAYAAIREAAKDHKDVDHVVARPYASERAADLLLELHAGVPTASNAKHYAGIVKRASEARKALDVAGLIRQKVMGPEWQDAPEYAASLVEELNRDRHDSGAATYEGSLEEFGALVDKRRANEGVTGIRTGLSRMDRGLGGLNPGMSYIVAARPGVGKSLVAGQIAQTAANNGNKVLLQTPEMSAVQYLDRMAHALAGVDYERSREGKISDQEAQNIKGAASLLAKLPIHVDDHGTQTAARVRANVMRHRPDLLIVDYLQYLTPQDARGNRTQQVGQLSRDITKLKADFQIPVVVCAQLSRAVEQRENKIPNLADLRDSGEIEQDADAVMFLYRPGRYSESAPQDELEVHCEKWRFGDPWQTTLYLKPGANWLVNNRWDMQEDIA